MNDRNIIQLYFKRNEKAIHETERKYGAYCYSIANNTLGNHEDSEECVSDTWLRAWNAIPPQRPTRLRSFLARITRNAAIDCCRRQDAGRRINGNMQSLYDELEECLPDNDTVETEIETLFTPHQRILIYHKSGWFKWVGAAICIVLFLIMGSQVLLPGQSQKTSDPRLAGNEPVSLASISSTPPNIIAGDSQTVTDESFADRPYANTDSLLTYPDSETEYLKLASIQLNNRNAVYELVSSIPSNQLKEYVGETLADNKDWYLLSGHEEHQYLIRHEKKNSYSLWEFNSFEDKSYPYKDVLEVIYGIHSVEDITKILVSPADMDNTDAGIALQKKIGTIIIDKPEDLATVYRVLSSLTCLGTDQWDRIGLLDDSPSAMLNAVRKSRYLTIITDQGKRQINRIKYTGISHMFYEYQGIAYKALKEKKAGEIEKLLEIE